MERKPKNSSLLITALLLISLSLLPGCGQKQPGKDFSSSGVSNAATIHSSILRVKDSVYTNSDFVKYLVLVAGEGYKNLEPSSLSRLFDNFVDEKILLEAAQEKKITPTPEEQKKYLAKLWNESWLIGKRLNTKEVEFQVLHEQLLIDKYIFELVKNIEVSENEIRDYYQSQKREFLRPERIKVSQILLATEDKAIEILDSLKNTSEENFRNTAKAVSIGFEGSRGGELGMFEMGQLPYEMEKVVFSLKKGELSRVVQSSYGYHIFRLDKRFDPELVSVEEAGSQIRFKILDQKLKQAVLQHIEEIKEKLDWAAYTENLTFRYQRIADE